MLAAPDPVVRSPLRQSFVSGSGPQKKSPKRNHRCALGLPQPRRPTFPDQRLRRAGEALVRFGESSKLAFSEVGVRQVTVGHLHQTLHFVAPARDQIDFAVALPVREAAVSRRHRWLATAVSANSRRSGAPYKLRLQDLSHTEEGT